MREAVALVVAVVTMASLARPPPPALRGEHLEPTLPREEVFRVFGAFHLHLMADYLWLGAIQTLGRAHKPYEYRDVYFYGDLLTELDPEFEYAYLFTGTSSTYHMGRERWVNTEESTRILRKGVKQFPQSVRLNVVLAYNLSHFHKRYKEAADVLTRVIHLPGAPPYLSQLATRLYAQSGQFDSGLALAEAMHESADDPETREFFEQRAKEIQLESVLSKVERAFVAFRTRENRAPNSIAELVGSGDLDETPVDPLGGTLRFDATGVASSTAQERRLRVFEDENFK